MGNTTDKCANCNTLSGACRRGHLNCLKNIQMRWIPTWVRDGYEACVVAAEYGNLDCIICLRENIDTGAFLTSNIPWDERVCGRAALNNHLDCLIYAHENGSGCWHSSPLGRFASCPWSETTFVNAISSGSIE